MKSINTILRKLTFADLQDWVGDTSLNRGKRYVKHVEQLASGQVDKLIRSLNSEIRDLTSEPPVIELKSKCFGFKIPVVRFYIRSSTPDDGTAVTELLQASYPPLMKPAYDPGVLSVALTLMTTANADLLASGTYFVAETDRGRLVGCGGWTRQAPGVGKVVDSIGHIRHFATHPDWLGQGVGSAIYMACERQASRLGVTQFDCFASLNAEGFYAALGFKRIRRVEVTTPNVTFPAVLVRRTI